MEKIILSALALISCLSLGSCSNEKPSSSMELGEKDSLLITQNSQKIDFNYGLSIPCIGTYSSFGASGNLLLYPFAYCKIKVDIFNSYLKVYVNFDFKKLNSDIEKHSSDYTQRVDSIYSSEDLNMENPIGQGFATNDDENNLLFVYDQYKSYTYTYGFDSEIQFNIIQEVSK